MKSNPARFENCLYQALHSADEAAISLAYALGALGELMAIAQQPCLWAFLGGIWAWYGRGMGVVWAWYGRASEMIALKGVHIVIFCYS